jgi:hypothetical protein
MATQEDIFKEICDLVREGAQAEGMPVAAAVDDMLHGRYFEWITLVKEGNAQSPMDVWDAADGDRIKNAFRAIGRTAAVQCKADGKDTVDSDEGAAASDRVEADSDCPFCPPKP